VNRRQLFITSLFLLFLFRTSWLFLCVFLSLLLALSHSLSLSPSCPLS